VRIIDIHAHIFPDEIAPTTIKYLGEEANTKAYLNGTVSDLKSSMKKAGISISVNQPISTKPSQVQSINNCIKQLQDDTIISLLLDSFPGLTIIASHMGECKLWDDVETECINLDTTSGRELATLHSSLCNVTYDKYGRNRDD